MSKLLIALVLTIVIIDIFVETVDGSHGCPRTSLICSSACKARGFSRGYCRGSQCRCVGVVRVCPRYSGLCRIYCRRKGYRYGSCRGTKCRCYRWTIG